MSAMAADGTAAETDAMFSAGIDPTHMLSLLRTLLPSTNDADEAAVEED